MWLLRFCCDSCQCAPVPCPVLRVKFFLPPTILAVVDDDGRVKTSELSSKLQQAGGPAKLGVLLSVLQSSANAALDWEEALSLAQLDSAVPKLGRLPSSEEKRESMEADRGWAPGPGLCGPGVSLGEASLLLLFEGAEWETRVDVGLTVEYVKLLAREHFADSLRGVYADAQLELRLDGKPLMDPMSLIDYEIGAGTSSRIDCSVREV
ncbi:hypothetical protein EMIHUDRAFT_249989 [Emiliania huxleyi CCMP1516]|uniref:Ubiquitin-like domain-containing protein n=2 Tax=Emiliania huxleyi TaxID=2903 RepID=A0A0D3I4Q5_EMIH1|nr:hypothetical protein EMIHUDRAFT_249989 [Emiliania huxleyi CCMP1516]EOD06240.1 hypothetical protein EMIHUDRAFT_249989 [Emiliania huxleyi CCMP1516]|eukprot:XP_005758669.1 hypothetical protein EMIHUDRAFT_249989 [Emiliania huxleyi CCMP1516]